MKQATILLIAILLFACKKEIDVQPKAKITLITSGHFNMKGKPSSPPGKNKPPQPIDTTTPPPPTDTVVVPPPAPSTEFALVTGPITNQSPELSCVAHAVANARTIDWYYKTGNLVRFSTEFLYNPNKFSNDCGSGSNPAYMLQFVQTYGVCRYDVMPNADGCSLMPNSSQYADAANYKIGELSYVLTSDHDAIKYLIQQHRAIIITVGVDSQFLNAKQGFIWSSGGGGAGHTLIICGYDDSKNAWKLMNSYGTAWGDNGFGWMDYDFLPLNSNAWGHII